MRDIKEYTPEEINKNYELKIVKRILKSDYPWIKELNVEEKVLNKYGTLIFLDVIVDLDKLEEITQTPTPKYISAIVDKDGKYDSYSLANLIGDFDTASPITREIDNKLIKIHESNSIPEHMKVEGRRFAIGNYIVLK